MSADHDNCCRRLRTLCAIIGTQKLIAGTVFRTLDRDLKSLRMGTSNNQNINDRVAGAVSSGEHTDILEDGPFGTEASHTKVRFRRPLQCHLEKDAARHANQKYWKEMDV